MAAYSLDLRKRIVDAVERGVGTISEIASLFGVHESFIYKLRRQKRERGDIAPLPHGGGAEAKLNEDHLMILTDLVAKSPDATLDELREQMKKQTGVEVSVPTIWRALDALGLSRKKNPSEPPRLIQSNGPSSKRNKKRYRLRSWSSLTNSASTLG
jgi:transposase